MRAASFKAQWMDLLSAVQFLTRIPVPTLSYETGSLSRSVKYFPAIGLLVGGCSALLHTILVGHLSRLITALFVLTFLVLLTGCLHEDGLADAADGFGGGWSREQVLSIMRDSRIGSYGAVSLILSLLFRCILMSAIPLLHMWQYLIAAQVLCRWTALPLGFFLPAARAMTAEVSDGQGARVAHQTTAGTLVFGSLFTLVALVLVLRSRAVMPILLSGIVTLASGLYYQRRLGGITGDCFGATIQLSEIAVYLCGVWAA